MNTFLDPADIIVVQKNKSYPKKLSIKEKNVQLLSNHQKQFNCLLSSVMNKMLTFISFYICRNMLKIEFYT